MSEQAVSPIQNACYCLAKNSWRRQWKKYVFLFYTCISLWELIEILIKKYFREMDRATFIAQPLIIGMTELFVIVVARRRPLYLMVSVCGVIPYGNTYCTTWPHNQRILLKCYDSPEPTILIWWYALTMSDLNSTTQVLIFLIDFLWRIRSLTWFHFTLA